ASWWHQRTTRRLTARHRAALLALAASTDGSRAIDLPGGRALREYGVLRVASEATNEPQNGALRLTPGDVKDWHGWRLAFGAELAGSRDVAQLAGSQDIAQLDASDIAVRARRPGDRMDGPRAAKVQDVFVDAKVPARLRDRWPLVTVQERIVWIPGITPPPASGPMMLRVVRMGEIDAGMTRGDGEQVASLSEGRSRSAERGKRRT
ncbi:MAG TPA: tRNA lysidine(34) synthetase TilS, partial [Candidatus Limnocylindria bacterium]|nr:tRNA lysidine(34) synthetase TilS [Candidatus Limnocylindria bacterium]